MVLSKHNNFELIQKKNPEKLLYEFPSNGSDDENLPPAISENMETKSIQGQWARSI